MTVIFPINESFRCCHRFKQLQNASSFGLKFVVNILYVFVLLLKTIPKAFAFSEPQEKFLFLQYFISLFFKRPALKTEHFEEFNLRPDI